MSKIFEILAKSQQASQYAIDQKGRNPYPTLAVVTNVEDPENLRRVKVSDPSSPGLDTDWLIRLNLIPDYDPVLPNIGDTVLVFWVDGDPSNGLYMSIQNATNPPLDKVDPVNDQSQNVQGNSNNNVGKDRKDTVNKVYTIEVGESFRLQNSAGAYIELATSGVVIISDAFGHKMTFGAGSGNNAIEWDMGSSTLKIKNCSDLQVSQTASGYKSVATVGAVDSRGDTIVNRGW